jgi:hypothetical protein
MEVQKATTIISMDSAQPMYYLNAQSQRPPTPSKSVSERLVDRPMEVQKAATLTSMDSAQPMYYLNAQSQRPPPPTPRKSVSEMPLMASTTSMISGNSIRRTDSPKLLEVPNEVENYDTVKSMESVRPMSHLVRKSNSTDGSSSASVVENPTFQTLRRSKDTRPSSGITETNFEAMKAAAKKSNNPQAQFDFAT